MKKLEKEAINFIEKPKQENKISNNFAQFLLTEKQENSVVGGTYCGTLDVVQCAIKDFSCSEFKWTPTGPFTCKEYTHSCPGYVPSN